MINIRNMFRYSQEEGSGSAGGTLDQFAAAKKAAEEAKKRAEAKAAAESMKAGGGMSGTQTGTAITSAEAANAARNSNAGMMSNYVDSVGSYVPNANANTAALNKSPYELMMEEAYAAGGLQVNETIPGAVTPIVDPSELAGVAGVTSGTVPGETPVVETPVVETPEEGGEEGGEEEQAITDFEQYLKGIGLGDLSIKTSQTALERMMADNANRMASTSQSYGDMYQQARDLQNRRKGLSNTSGFSGGMADQYSDKLSAVEMSSLAQIGMGREEAIRGLEAEKGTYWSDALLEGQQVEEYSRGKTTENLQYEAMINDMVASGSIDQATADNYLEALGVEGVADGEVLGGYLTGADGIKIDLNNLTIASTENAKTALAGKFNFGFGQDKQMDNVFNAIRNKSVESLEHSQEYFVAKSLETGLISESDLQAVWDEIGINSLNASSEISKELVRAVFSGESIDFSKYSDASILRALAGGGSSTRTVSAVENRVNATLKQIWKELGINQ